MTAAHAIVSAGRHVLAAGFIALAGLATSPATASAEEHVVEMLNRGESGIMVFEPALVRAMPGDTVRFVPVDPSHNAVSVEGMMPAEAETLEGGMNEEVVYTVEQQGVYGIHCTPHYAMGMVALIQVGDDLSNLDEAREAAAKAPGRAKTVFAKLFEEVQAGE
ncbi:pseudoazurin [Aurantimonas endophytica]|uniref:Pseudoazurin n=1 Tax=Aurantimonas endophytica TaxID=1522175 RepID=A0A7W6HDK6_9HYPH|nr:pseudoazurin [Aurantimonas endophytica]MBB4003191.1 pseudoazurin [Aurantimonas endophytica]MCO6404056.1 pseudoazurin [Aurantimonas endophytica]